MNSVSLALALLARDLRERYLSTFAGFAWVILTPVVLLSVYAFVFVQLLGARFGDRVGGDVIAFLALGMWPWYAFSDSLSRGTSALTANAALLGQIALPRVWLVLVPALGAILIHTASFLIVLVVLAVLGKVSIGLGWLCAMAAYLLLVVNAVALSLLLAPLNVFFRDVATLLPQILTFWMLLTPIFFDRQQLRPDLREWLAINPMAGVIETIRDGILFNRYQFDVLIVPAVVSLIVLSLAVAITPRFLRRIEDFL